MPEWLSQMLCFSLSSLELRIDRGSESSECPEVLLSMWILDMTSERNRTSAYGLLGAVQVLYGFTAPLVTRRKPNFMGCTVTVETVDHWASDCLRNLRLT